MGIIWMQVASHSIKLPPRVKKIGEAAFEFCGVLQNVDLLEGLEIIGKRAFGMWCPALLRHIQIPSTVHLISPNSSTYDFIQHKDDIYMTNMKKVQFCDKIEEFVLGDNGVSKYSSLETYNNLVFRNIPTHLGQLIRQWKAHINEMLRSLSSIHFEALHKYFYTIESKLADYESLPNAISVLELAIWKSNLLEQFGLLDMKNVSSMAKLQCPVECGACVIIPDILSFLYRDRSRTCKTGTEPVRNGTEPRSGIRSAESGSRTGTTSRPQPHISGIFTYTWPIWREI